MVNCNCGKEVRKASDDLWAILTTKEVTSEGNIEDKREYLCGDCVWKVRTALREVA